jgi:hypothetical protein
LKRQCLEGYFHGKVKNNALSIKNGRATPKRYHQSNLSCIVVHNIQVAAADALAVATADSAFAVAALTDELSIIAEVVDAAAADATAAATAVATSDSAAAITDGLSADPWSLNADGTVQTPAPRRMTKSWQVKPAVDVILRAGSTGARQVVARRKDGRHKRFCQQCMC